MKNGVKNIQALGYNGAGTVYVLYPALIVPVVACFFGLFFINETLAVIQT